MFMIFRIEAGYKTLEMYTIQVKQLVISTLNLLLVPNKL